MRVKRIVGRGIALSGFKGLNEGCGARLNRGGFGVSMSMLHGPDKQRQEVAQALEIVGVLRADRELFDLLVKIVVSARRQLKSRMSTPNDRPLRAAGSKARAPGRYGPRAQNGRPPRSGASPRLSRAN